MRPHVCTLGEWAGDTLAERQIVCVCEIGHDHTEAEMEER